MVPASTMTSTNWPHSLLSDTSQLVLATRPGTNIHPFSSSKNAVIQANQKFTPGERPECYPLALRLHHAEFTQNSFYVRDSQDRSPCLLLSAPTRRRASVSSTMAAGSIGSTNWRSQ
ncbi:hypothetical protein R3P38DRAFT_224605 [Favolaschia claudopus]|uniref:Uncharacterized protein n=1 Tax=Favolaschia claudopus TaxID=2862362 RepID=A0AAV9ZTK9_9AGAR